MQHGQLIWTLLAHSQTCFLGPLGYWRLRATSHFPMRPFSDDVTHTRKFYHYTTDHTEVFRLLDQDPFKKLVHACKYGLLKQALYLKSKPEYCVFTIRSMSCVLTGRTPIDVNGGGTYCALSRQCKCANFKWILVKQPENLRTWGYGLGWHFMCGYP